MMFMKRKRQHKLYHFIFSKENYAYLTSGSTIYGDGLNYWFKVPETTKFNINIKVKEEKSGDVYVKDSGNGNYDSHYVVRMQMANWNEDLKEDIYDTYFVKSKLGDNLIEIDKVDLFQKPDRIYYGMIKEKIPSTF